LDDESGAVKVSWNLEAMAASGVEDGAYNQEAIYM